MGLLIDRDVDALGPARIHPVPAVVLPIDTTVITVRIGRAVNRVDKSQLAIVPARHAERTVARMRAHPNGREAAVIGSVVADRAGLVVLETAVGGRRIVDLLPGEQLPRIC